MSDVCMSYAPEDRDRARVLAQALESCGWSVWWDPEILPGETWDDVIERELAAARCVVVLWSSRSIGKKWVRRAADDAGLLLRCCCAEMECLRKREGREPVSRWIEELAARHARSRIVVTARFAGYRGAELARGHLQIDVEAFRRPEIEAFLRRWYDAVETRLHGDTPDSVRRADAGVRARARGQRGAGRGRRVSSADVLAIAEMGPLQPAACSPPTLHAADPPRRRHLVGVARAQRGRAPTPRARSLQR